MAPNVRFDFDPLLAEFSSSYDGSTTCTAATPSSGSTLVKKSKQRGRSVAFCKTVKIHTVPSRKHFSKQEMESLHMSRQDFLGIKHGVIFRLNQLEQQGQGQTTNDNDDETTNSSDNDDDTLRGLEECGPKTYMERRRRIDSAVQTVLRRQKLGCDDELTSELYRKCVRQSSWTAHLRGLQDEQESQYQSPPKKTTMVRS
jgi:hypothetical protein